MMVYEFKMLLTLATIVPHNGPSRAVVHKSRRSIVSTGSTTRAGADAPVHGVAAVVAAVTWPCSVIDAACAHGSQPARAADPRPLARYSNMQARISLLSSSGEPLDHSQQRKARATRRQTTEFETRITAPSNATPRPLLTPSLVMSRSGARVSLFLKVSPPLRWFPPPNAGPTATFSLFSSLLFISSNVDPSFGLSRPVVSIRSRSIVSLLSHLYSAS
jgi:hypothetical protein